jgi:hypothetical protein
MKRYLACLTVIWISLGLFPALPAVQPAAGGCIGPPNRPCRLRCRPFLNRRNARAYQARAQEYRAYLQQMVVCQVLPQSWALDWWAANPGPNPRATYATIAKCRRDWARWNALTFDEQNLELIKQGLPPQAPPAAWFESLTPDQRNAWLEKMGRPAAAQVKPVTTSQE